MRKHRKHFQRRKLYVLNAAEREGLAIQWMKVYGPISGIGKRTMRERLRKWSIPELARKSLEELRLEISKRSEELDFLKKEI